MQLRPGAMLLAALLGAPLAAAAAQATQDWPCVQPRQPRLSVAQMWPGAPPSAEAARLAREDAGLRRLAAQLAARRTDLAEAGPLIAAFAGEAGAARADRLAGLFLAAFAEIEPEREALLDGIARTGAGQGALAAQVEARRARMAELSAAAPPDFDAIDAEEAKLDWDTRIFAERQQMLSAVCESPVILERRLFELARLIAGAG